MVSWIYTDNKDTLKHRRYPTCSAVTAGDHILDCTPLYYENYIKHNQQRFTLTLRSLSEAFVRRKWN